MNNRIIFYADDDCDDRLLFEEAAATIPGKVVLFESGINLLASLQQFIPAPSIIFMDLNMPGKSGFEIVAEIKGCDRFKNIPVVVLSTASDHYNINKVRNCGANFFISKPTSFVKLRLSIEHTFKIDWGKFAPSIDDFYYRPGE